MANDGDWVEDVKRWYFAGGATEPGTVASIDAAAGDYGVDLGYEAAHPALQARHWPDAAAITKDR